jgi:carbon storage regulator
MLVLTRKRNESIQVGEMIRITVVEIHSGRVRIGIEAPSEVRIRRGELPPARQAPDVEYEWEIEPVGVAELLANSPGRAVCTDLCEERARGCR